MVSNAAKTPNKIRMRTGFWIWPNRDLLITWTKATMLEGLESLCLKGIQKKRGGEMEMVKTDNSFKDFALKDTKVVGGKGDCRVSAGMILE